MPRTLWTGTISFGLVSIPIRMYTATRDRSVHLHMLSPDGSCRLRRKLYCPETGEEFDFQKASRGYEVGPGQYVILGKEERERLRPDAGKIIDIKDFVDITQVDPIYLDRPYYLTPTEPGRRAYRLLLRVLKQTGKVAVAKFVMRSREYLALLRPMDLVLGLETMRFHDEVNSIQELPDLHLLTSPEEPGEREMKIATQLVEAMSGDFRPEAYHDEYNERLRQVIEQKAQGREIVLQEPGAPEPGRVIDLMEMLERSLNQNDRKARDAS